MSDDMVTIDRPLYLTEDGGRVVEENDPRARWLHWTKGMRVTRAEYDRLTVRVQVVSLPEPPKQQPPRPNKSRRPNGNK